VQNKKGEFAIHDAMVIASEGRKKDNKKAGGQPALSLDEDVFIFSC
jgi:hypothetical protein